jgi:hypothetical protein
MFTLETSRTYSDPSIRREENRQRYLTNRATILEALAAMRRALKPLAEQTPAGHTEAHIIDPDRVVDIRPFLDRNRREVMEGIRLRLIWASSAGGDEGAVAKAAVAVIHFAETQPGGHWTDRSLRALHRRLSLAEGLTPERFDHAREAIGRELFVPL